MSTNVLYCLESVPTCSSQVSNTGTNCVSLQGYDSIYALVSSEILAFVCEKKTHHSFCL